MAQNRKIIWFFIATLAILSIMVIIPPIYHHYIYPNTSDDTSHHLMYFMDMKPALYSYFGRVLVGSMLNSLPFNIVQSFLWFNYAMFVLLIIIIGLVIAYTVGIEAGIVSSILVSFGYPIVLSMFGQGKIFDIINIGIIFPLLMLCFYNVQKNIYWKLGACLLSILFLLFHPTGLLICVILPMVVFYEMFGDKIANRLSGVASEIWQNRILVYLPICSFATYCGYLIGYSADPTRLRDDAGILALIFIGSIVGKYVFSARSVLTKVLVIIIIVALGIVTRSYAWFEYNNAVDKVDEQAFSYLNTLDGEHYIASYQVAQEIYDLYTDKTFTEDMDTADYAIVRSSPMTEGCDPLDYWFTNQSRLGLLEKLDEYGYQLVHVFDCGEKDSRNGQPVTVSIYERF